MVRIDRENIALALAALGVALQAVSVWQNRRKPDEPDDEDD